MRSILFVNGRIDDLSVLRNLVRDDDYLVAADAGALHCLALDRRPHVVVGDLDSLAPAIVQELAAQGTIFERHPSAKDQTDLELAIERAIADGADEILLVGASGGRLDQALGNLLLLAQREWKATLKVLDGNQIAQLLRGGQQLTFHDQIGATLSILPLSAVVTGITYQGMAYPLNNAALQLGSTRGISNQIIASPASVTIESGVLVVVWGISTA